jgi:RNA polymerase sigma-70 factor (ECF subfamily)
MMVDRFQRDVMPQADRIFCAALRLARNRQDAEDLVQEVMLRAYVNFDSFRDGSNVHAWLYRILHNTWISLYRKARCRPNELLVERMPDLQSNMYRSAEESALESIVDIEVATALAALNEQMRIAVFYADVLQFSCQEIAVITDSPIGTVSSRLHRGRKQLRAHLIPAAAQAA